MSSSFSNFLKNDNVQLSLYIFGALVVLGLTIWLVVFLWQRALSNGATAAQVMVGKKIGELCTADAMCGTNKCRRNICVI
jgi:hypothetical protein